jgi:hypothetical protein
LVWILYTLSNSASTFLVKQNLVSRRRYWW